MYVNDYYWGKRMLVREGVTVHIDNPDNPAFRFRSEIIDNYGTVSLGIHVYYTNLNNYNGGVVNIIGHIGQYARITNEANAKIVVKDGAFVELMRLMSWADYYYDNAFLVNKGGVVIFEAGSRY